MNIDLLLNNNAEVVSLSEKGMSVIEYLYSFTSSEDAPASMMVNTANGDLIRESLATAPTELSQSDVSNSSGRMRITINDMLTDDDVMLFRAKPATQGVGIGEALQQLIADQMGVSADFLGEDNCKASTVREVESRAQDSESFWVETSQRNNLMRKVSNPYRDGDWFESCKPDDHD